MKYRFYIETTDGQRVEWTGISRTQALGMYLSTNKAAPANVLRFGWDEVK